MKLNFRKILRKLTILVTGVVVLLLVVYALARVLDLRFSAIEPELQQYIVNNFSMWATEVLVLLALVNFLGVTSEEWYARATKKSIDRMTLGLLRRAANSSSGGGMCVKDKDLKVVFCNEAFLAPYGLAPRELKGQKLTDHLPLLVRQVFEELDTKALETRKEASTVTPGMGRNREKAFSYQLISATPAYDDDGQLIGIVNMVSDYTQQHKAEYELELGRRHSQFLFNNMPLAAFVIKGFTDKDTGLLDFYVQEGNPIFLKYLEGHEIPYTKSARTCWPDIGQHLEMWDGIARLLSGQPRVSLELFSSISSREFRLHMAWLGQDKILCTLTDITESRQAQAQLFQRTDQLRTTLMLQKANSDRLLNDYNEFLAIVGDTLEPIIDELEAQEGNSAAHSLAETVNNLRSNVVLYASAGLLPSEVTLTSVFEVVEDVFEKQASVTPNVRFSQEKLPRMVLSEEVLKSTLKNLLSLVCSLPAKELPAVHIEMERSFLDSQLAIHVTDFDFSELFPEEDFESPELNWTASRSLRLAAVNRMVLSHGSFIRVSRLSKGIKITIHLPSASPLL